MRLARATASLEYLATVLTSKPWKWGRILRSEYFSFSDVYLGCLIFTWLRLSRYCTGAYSQYLTLQVLTWFLLMRWMNDKNFMLTMFIAGQKLEVWCPLSVRRRGRNWLNSVCGMYLSCGLCLANHLRIWFLFSPVFHNVVFSSHHFIPIPFRESTFLQSYVQVNCLPFLIARKCLWKERAGIAIGIIVHGRFIFKNKFVGRLIGSVP